MKKSMEKYGDSLQSFFSLIEQLTMLQRIIVSVVVFAIMVGGFVFLSYKPKFEELDRINTQYEKVKKDLDIAKKKASQLEAKKKEWAEKEEQFKLAMNALPDKKEIPSLLDEISRAGNESGLEFKQFSPLGEVTKQFYAEIPVSLDIVGEYKSVFSFFQKVAEMSRIVNMKDISMKIDTGKQDDDSMLVSTTCKAVTYRFLSPDEAKSAQGGKANAQKKKKR